MTEAKKKQGAAIDSLQMLTTEDVAKVLCTTVQTVSMLREVGILKAIKIGKSYVFSQIAVCDLQANYEGEDISNYQKAYEAKNRKESNGTQSSFLLARGLNQ